VREGTDYLKDTGTEI